MFHPCLGDEDGDDVGGDGVYDDDEDDSVDKPDINSRVAQACSFAPNNFLLKHITIML